MLDILNIQLDVNTIIYYGYRLIGYSFFLTAIYMIIRSLLKRIRRKSGYDLRSITGKIQEEYSQSILKPENISYGKKIVDHVQMLLRTVFKKEVDASTFLYVSVFLALVVFFLTYNLVPSRNTAVFISLSVMVLPYFWLRVRLNRIRSKTSHQLLPAVNVLLQKYRTNNNDIYSALRKSIPEINGTVKESFFLIIDAIQQRKKTEEAIRLFHFQIDTFFSLQLAICIAEAIRHQKNIDNALSRLVQDMTESANIIEQEKSESRDNVQLGAMPLIVLPVSIVVNQYISAGRAYYFYFQHPDGRNVLLTTVVICMFAFFVSMYSKTPKNDL